MIDKLLPLTSTDLEGLEDESEEWLIGEGEDEEAWQFEFRVSPDIILSWSQLMKTAMRREGPHVVE